MPRSDAMVSSKGNCAISRLGAKYRDIAGQLKKEAKEKEAKDKKVKITPAMRKRNEQVAENMREKSREAFDKAAQSLRPYLKRDPTDPGLHFHLAAAWYGAGKPELAREEASKARRLDGEVRPPRNLTNDQREQLAKWLGEDSAR